MAVVGSGRRVTATQFWQSIPVISGHPRVESGYRLAARVHGLSALSRLDKTCALARRGRTAATPIWSPRRPETSPAKRHRPLLLLNEPLERQHVRRSPESAAALGERNELECEVRERRPVALFTGFDVVHVVYLGERDHEVARPTHRAMAAHVSRCVRVVNHQHRSLERIAPLGGVGHGRGGLLTARLGPARHTGRVRVQHDQLERLGQLHLLLGTAVL